MENKGSGNAIAIYRESPTSRDSLARAGAKQPPPSLSLPRSLRHATEGFPRGDVGARGTAPG